MTLVIMIPQAQVCTGYASCFTMRLVPQSSMPREPCPQSGDIGRCCAPFKRWGQWEVLRSLRLVEVKGMGHTYLVSSGVRAMAFYRLPDFFSGDVISPSLGCFCHSAVQY